MILAFVAVNSLDASRLPTPRRAPCLLRSTPPWGIRGGGGGGGADDEIQSDASETNDLNEEPVVVLTAEEEEEVAVSTNEVSAEVDEIDTAETDVKDAPTSHEANVPELLLSEESDGESVDENSDSIEDEVTAAIDELSSAFDDEQSMTAIREEAQELRQAGKELHDEGDWQEAAEKFHQASLLLQDFTLTNDEILQEYATCRLHEALCRLKMLDYVKSVQACTAVLERQPPAAIRARALHRRSRAKLGLGLEDEALLDARQAAFLGDRKAVALYGKLMRQDSSSAESTFGGSNPFLSSGNTPTSPSSSALFESLLNKSGEGAAAASPSSAVGGPLGMLMNGSSSSNKNGGLAKSVLSSLTKTVENESTQENICRYLQNTSVGQVQQLATMAGIPLSESHASRLVDFCHGVTPKGISKSVKTTKRLWYVISFLRKVSQIISKYRFVFIIWALTIWIKSAVKRPIPINKKALKLALKQGAV
jgi:tetratricopeptide (TPR) repeat protein